MCLGDENADFKEEMMNKTKLDYAAWGMGILSLIRGAQNGKFV